mgnify:CR=1 FL=1|jgi:uncharacterized protein YhhL (DUF1145 family)
MESTSAVTVADDFFSKVVTYFFSPIYQIAVAVAFLYFIYSVVLLLFQMDQPDKREQARKNLMYGILGLLIILSVGAIIEFFNDLLGANFLY